MYSIDQQQRILRETDIVNAQRRRHRGGVIVNASKRTTKTKPQWDFIAIAKQRAARTGETLSESMRYIAAHSPRRYSKWQEAQHDGAQKRPVRKPAEESDFLSLARQHAREHECSLRDSLSTICRDYPSTYRAWTREGCE